MRPPDLPEPRLWNPWWLLALAGFAATVVLAALEYRGIRRDIGIPLALVSLGVTVLGTAVASTRVSVRAVHADVRTIHAALGVRQDSLAGVQDTLGAIHALLEARLPAHPV